MAPLPRVLRSVILAATLLPIVQACGRSEPGDYLYSADGSISTGATSSSGGRNGGTAGARPTGGTSGTGTAGRATGGSAVGGSSIGDGGDFGVGGDSGGTGVGGSGVAGTTSVAGAAGTGNIVPISCGGDVCNTPDEKCCAGLGGFACVPSAQTCSGAVLGCTLNADCAADQVCCLSITGDPAAASACKTSCSPGSGTRDRQLCETAADCRRPFRYCTSTVFGVNVCTRTGPGQ